VGNRISVLDNMKYNLALSYTDKVVYMHIYVVHLLCAQTRSRPLHNLG